MHVAKQKLYSVYYTARCAKGLWSHFISANRKCMEMEINNYVTSTIWSIIDEYNYMHRQSPVFKAKLKRV